MQLICKWKIHNSLKNSKYDESAANTRERRQPFYHMLLTIKSVDSAYLMWGSWDLSWWNGFISVKGQVKCKSPQCILIVASTNLSPSTSKVDCSRQSSTNRRYWIIQHVQSYCCLRSSPRCLSFRSIGSSHLFFQAFNVCWNALNEEGIYTLFTRCQYCFLTFHTCYQHCRLHLHRLSSLIHTYIPILTFSGIIVFWSRFGCLYNLLRTSCSCQGRNCS